MQGEVAVGGMQQAVCVASLAGVHHAQYSGLSISNKAFLTIGCQCERYPGCQLQVAPMLTLKQTRPPVHACTQPLQRVLCTLPKGLFVSLSCTHLLQRVLKRRTLTSACA